MHTTLIINSIACTVGTLAGGFLALGSVISIANMRVPWVGTLIVAALLIPVVFAGAGIAVWMTYGRVPFNATVGLIAFPWCYTALFIAVMLFSFKQ